MLTIRDEILSDVPARELLLDQAFGPLRWQKASQQVRDGRLPAEGLAFAAVDAAGQLVGTLRLWHVQAGSAGAALLLGPLAVAAAYRGAGLGQALMQHGMALAQVKGHAAILLVGDASYYQRFGFSHAAVHGLYLPGAPDPERLLGLELVKGALDHAKGAILPTGLPALPVAQAA